jgi:hypothetical protein
MPNRITYKDPGGFCEHCGGGFYILYDKYQDEGILYCSDCMLANGDIDEHQVQQDEEDAELIALAWHQSEIDRIRNTKK